MKEYDGFLVDDNLTVYSKRSGKKLTPFIGCDGYYHIRYRIGDKKYHENRLHVILAHCFIDNPNNYKYVNHIDSNKLNNNLDNLEWCTNSYNVKHGWDSGNRTHKNNTKIDVYDLENKFIATFKSIRECGKELKIDRHRIARVLKGEIKRDCLGYLFKYAESQETIENIVNEKNINEEVSRVQMIFKYCLEVPSIQQTVIEC